MSVGIIMSVGKLSYFRRTAHIAYSRHPIARLYRCWRSFSGSEDELDDGPTNALLLPLAMLGLTLLLVGTVPGVSDAVAATCY
jgi:hypothetical protein